MDDLSNSIMILEWLSFDKSFPCPFRATIVHVLPNSVSILIITAPFWLTVNPQVINKVWVQCHLQYITVKWKWRWNWFIYAAEWFRLHLSQTVTTVLWGMIVINQTYKAKCPVPATICWQLIFKILFMGHSKTSLQGGTASHSNHDNSSFLSKYISFQSTSRQSIAC